MTSDSSWYTVAMYTKTAVPSKATNTGTSTTITFCPVSSFRRMSFEERSLQTIHGKQSSLW